MASDYKIFWTDEAIRDLELILDYLESNWSQKEIVKFKKKLGRQIELIEKNPKLFPLSNYKRKLRKAVLSKQTTFFYELSGDRIYLVYLFNTRQDPQKIK